MALTYDDLTAITRKYYHPKMVDNIFASNAGLQRAKKKWYKSLSGGDKIMLPLAYAKNTAVQWYTGSETLNVSSNPKKTAAEFEWKLNNAPIVITGKEELQNSGDAAVLSHIQTEMQMAEKSLADWLGAAMFTDATGSHADGIIGFKSMVLNSGTYGGIARSSNSWWNAQVDSSTTTLSLAKMQALYGDCTVDNDKPTVIFTTQDSYDDVYSLIQPQQRFADEDTIKAGFNHILWNNIPVIVDSHVDTGYLYMINERYVNLFYHKDRNFALEPFKKPTNQDVSYAHIRWAGAMCSTNCRMQGVMSALT